MDTSPGPPPPPGVATPGPMYPPEAHPSSKHLFKTGDNQSRL